MGNNICNTLQLIGDIVVLMFNSSFLDNITYPNNVKSQLNDDSSNNVNI